MSIGNNQLATFLQFPGSDLTTKYPSSGYANWYFFNTPSYPLLDTFALAYAIRAYINTTTGESSKLPKGYTGTVAITDVLVPKDCRAPGEYALTIGNETAYHTPAHAGVLCPELTNLQISFSDSVYDTTNVNMTALFEVTSFPLLATSDYVKFTFPEETYPYTFTMDPDARLELDVWRANYTLGTERVSWDGLIQPNISSSNDDTIVFRPHIQSRGNPNYATVPVGSVINLTVTDITMPWSCVTNQTFCVAIGSFSTCTVVEYPVTNCPVLDDLLISFTPSFYSTPDATMKLLFNATQNPLFAKSKYKVRVTFPQYQEYTAIGAHVVSAPLAWPWKENPAPSVKTMMKWQPQTLATNYSDGFVAMEFYLNGTGDQNPNYGQLFLDDESGFFEIGGIGLGSNCWEKTEIKLEVGPFAVTSLPEELITGCPNVTDLEVSFYPNYAGSTGVIGTFSFYVDHYPLPVEPLFIEIPYYTGSSKTFSVRDSGHDDLHFQVDGFANPTLTVYKDVMYYFQISTSAHRFGLFTCCNATGGLETYTDGVLENDMPPTGAGLSSGWISWMVPTSGHPASIIYTDPWRPWMNGTIHISTRPRGVQVTSNTRVGLNATSTADVGIFGEMFSDRVTDYWLSTSAPTITINNDSSVMPLPYSYTYSAFDTVVSPSGGTPGRIPQGRMSIQMQNLVLPDDCSNIGNITLGFGPWTVKGDPMLDTIRCPLIAKIDVDLATHVWGEKNVEATITIELFDAPLNPSEIKVLLPPGDDIEWASDAAIANAFADWVPSASLPTILNYADIERSLTQGFASGTPVMPNASAYPFHSGNKTQIVVRGINNPIHCTQLGNWTLKVGNARIDYDPMNDMIFCPNITALDVQFTPSANQSALTDALISFNVSDWVDPRWIMVYVPQPIDTTRAYIGSAMVDNGDAVGWELNYDHQNSYASGQLIRVEVTSGRRIAAGRHYIELKNITLPRGNCSDLGEWTIQIGDSLRLHENPPSDVVENCVILEELEINFTPDGEQGQIVDMVISYNVEEASLRYVPGDSDYITVRAAPESGVQFTSDSRFSSVMGGSWITEVGNPQIGAYFFSQKFTTGGMVPFHSRTEFTITNVQMPTTCYATGAWDINIGIWRLVSTPANKTSLAECPKITNLEVIHRPNVPGTELVEAEVLFHVEDMRLRPGALKFDFPAESDITLWTFAYVHGLWDWQPVGTPAIVPETPLHHHDLVDGHSHPDDEISWTQTFTGTPLEPGNYSFFLKGFALPHNNCTDLGHYKLAVGKWSSLWTNPTYDTLMCKGLISPINVTMVPRNLPRNYDNASFVFDFVVPSCEFNELEIVFPEGFTLGRLYPTEVVRVSGMDITTTEVVMPAANILQLRNISHTCFGTPDHPSDDWRSHSIELSNVGLGNNCDEGTFSVNTRTCAMMDRSFGLSAPVRICTKSEMNDGAGYVKSTEAMPKYCDLCNSCRWEMNHPTLGPVYECEYNGLKFQKTRMDETCSETQAASPMLW